MKNTRSGFVFNKSTLKRHFVYPEEQEKLTHANTVLIARKDFGAIDAPIVEHISPGFQLFQGDKTTPSRPVGQNGNAPGDILFYGP